MPFDPSSPANFTGRFQRAEMMGRQDAMHPSNRLQELGTQASIASLQALLRKLDPTYMESAERTSGAQDILDRDADLEYRAPNRTYVQGRVNSMANDARREEEFEDAGAAQDRYFLQEPMRRDQESASLRALRGRYTDPAIIRGQAELERERLRGTNAFNRQALVNQGGNERASINAFGDIAQSQVIGGNQAAGDTARSDLAGRMPAATSKVVGLSQLHRFAAQQGWTLDQAAEYAQLRGWTIQNDLTPE